MSTEHAERSQRPRWAPAWFWDVLPEPPWAVPQSRLPTVYLIITNPLKTAANTFGLFRKYFFHPSHDLDAFVSLSDLSNVTAPVPLPPPSQPEEIVHDPPWLFLNMSIWRLMRWANTGAHLKSEGEVNWLVSDVLTVFNFHVKVLQNFGIRRENHHLDTTDKASPLGDNFESASVTIEVPTGQPGDPLTPCTYPVPSLCYCKLLNIIKAAFQDPLSRHFHFTPFSLKHQLPTTSKEQHVYDELYNSDTFINKHKRVQNWSPPPPDDPGCKLEKVIATLMFWSDSTHLTNFGTAKLWPIYLFFGNLSKYIWSRLSSGACHHIAYIPSVRILIIVCWNSQYLLMHSIAAWFFWELDFKLASTLGYTASSADGSLPPGAHSSSLEVPPGWWSRSCHDIWHCGRLPQQSKMPDLSAYFYLFCRLSWEVGPTFSQSFCLSQCLESF